jgi:peptidoglycan biosynthesis protein MviN/MurJ (putative lipid II flippase)
LRLLLPRAFSIGALQIVGAVVVAVASRGTPGTVTAYTIAFSLASLPVAIIGTSIGTALLPRVARLRGAGDHGTGARESAAGLQGALPLLIGAAIGLACYAPEAASVVLLGASASGALLITALPLIAPAAISYGLLAIIVRLRFAADDGRTPLIAAIGGMLVAVAVAPLVPPESAALLLSCSGAAQLALLLLVERDRTSGLSIVGALRAPRLWRTALAVAAPALLASALDLPRPSLVLALIAAGAATASLLWRR